MGLAGLVLCAALLVRVTHPGRPLLAWGVPALLACAPPDGLFYVTGDGVSMFAGGAAFAALAALHLAPAASPIAWAGAGALTAFAFLVKAPNVVLVVGVAGLALEAWRSGALAERASRVAALGLGFGLPVGAWMVRCLALTGSALGTAGKVEGLGWGVRPLADWVSHPLFTPSGWLTFSSELTPMFWRGEIVWRREILSLGGADAFYGVSTLACLGLAALGWRRGSPPARGVEAWAGCVLLGSIAVLAVLSIRFVFGETTNPTADHPYFIQGRLVAGAWLAFALLYVRGVDVAVERLPAAWRGPVGAAVMAIVCGRVSRVRTLAGASRLRERVQRVPPAGWLLMETPSPRRLFAYALGSAGYLLADRIVVTIAVYFYLPRRAAGSRVRFRTACSAASSRCSAWRCWPGARSTPWPTRSSATDRIGRARGSGVAAST